GGAAGYESSFAPERFPILRRRHESRGSSWQALELSRYGRELPDGSRDAAEKPDRPAGGRFRRTESASRGGTVSEGPRYDRLGILRIQRGAVPDAATQTAKVLHKR